MIQYLLIAGLVLTLFPGIRRRLGRLAWVVVAALFVFLVVVTMTQSQATMAPNTVPEIRAAAVSGSPSASLYHALLLGLLFGFPAAGLEPG